MLELIGLQQNLVGRTSARVLENREGNDLSSTAVVFPSRRFGFFLRQELAAGVEGNFFPPPCLPIEAFFESLFRLNFPGRRILDELEAAHAVHESAGAVFRGGMYGSRAGSDFAAFLPWAQKILAALEEILTEGKRVEGIDFAPNTGSSPGWATTIAPIRIFILKIPDLLADLGRRLGSRRQATRGMASRMVADLAEEGGLDGHRAGCALDIQRLRCHGRTVPKGEFFSFFFREKRGARPHPAHGPQGPGRPPFPVPGCRRKPSATWA